MIHHLFNQGSRLQDFHLIVKIVSHGEHTQILKGSHRIITASTFLVTFFDEYGRINIIDRSLITEIDESRYNTNQHTGYKPRPIGKVFKKQGIKINVLLTLLGTRRGVLLFVSHINSL